MTGRSKRRVSQKTRKIPVARKHVVVVKNKSKRGRPKGAKNKPKPISPPIVEVVKKRGRPKGAKNKPKIAPAAVAALTKPITAPVCVPAPIIKKRGRPKGAKNKTIQETPTVLPMETSKIAVSTQNTTHPVMTAVLWLEKHMPEHEMQWYRRRASRLELSLNKTMALDLLAFFNVHDQEIKKQIKAL